MELEGRFISTEALAEVIRNVGLERMSGTLVLRCGTISTDFQFHYGKLSGSGNRDRPRRLGQILLNRGLIDRAALEEALAYQADFSPGTPIGRVLIHRGRLTVSDLREAVRLQVEEEMWDILSHGDGFYQFKKEDPESDEPLVELEPDPLVTEVLARREEWNKIRATISSDTMVPAVVKIRDSPDRESLHLGEREWRILSLVNGYFDVGCIATRSGFGRFETFKILHSFVSSGLIDLRPSQEPPATLSDEHPDVANATDTSANSSSSSSRWSGILSRLREESDQLSVPEATRLQFDSPVAFLVAICNQVMLKLMANQDFIVDPSDERLAERYWRQVLMSYPRADLVTASQNVLASDSFDRYTRSLGVEGPMKSIYLETVEALNRYLRTLYLLSAQRLGSKAAKNVFLHVMDDMRQRSAIGNSESFFFKEAAAKVLE
jgi:hypothetical protein